MATLTKEIMEHIQNQLQKMNDNNSVVINGHTLDVPNDKFDFRN